MQVPKPNHKRRVPKQGKRNEFPQKVIDEIKKRAVGKCEACLVKRGAHSHHVKPRSRGGRGVLTNGLYLCNGCHTLIHKDMSMMDEWINRYKSMYGEDFYKDEWDR